MYSVYKSIRATIMPTELIDHAFSSLYRYYRPKLKLCILEFE